MRTKDFREFRKNTLRGFFILEVAPGLEISDCTLHEQNGKSWFGFPGIPWTDKDGKKAYKNVIFIPDKSLLEKVQREVCKLLVEHLDGASGDGDKPAW